MNIKATIPTVNKKSVVVLVITFLITAGLWGSGFWALNQPEWNGGIDRLTYIKAARNFFARGNLYIDTNQALPEDLNFYNYSPLSIFSVGFLSFLPREVLYALHFLAVTVLFLLWKTIFKRINIDIPIWIIPFWYAFSPFVYDSVTLNVNVFMALLATLYLLFLLKDSRSATVGAIVMFFLMVTIKPQWGFVAFLPLVQRKWKKFFQIIAGLLILFLITLGLACILTTPEYVIQQHVLYVKHLETFAQRFTYWNLPPGPYEYNNSIYQVVIYLMGDIKVGIATARFIQLGLFVSLAVVFAMAILTQRIDANNEEPDRNYIRWFFIFYCATLLYPPLNFDFSLGIPLFLFLAVQGLVQKILVGIPVFIIAFQDLIRMVISSFGASGWFPFIFTATVIALLFLLGMKRVSTHNEWKVSLVADKDR